MEYHASVCTAFSLLDSQWMERFATETTCIVSLYIAFHPDMVSVFFMGSQMCAERTCRKYDFGVALECLECPLFTPPSSFHCVTPV